MSHFYARLSGDRGDVTKCGSKKGGITAEVASWKGCVEVQLYVDKDTGKDCYSVRIKPWQGVGEYKHIAEGAFEP